MNNCTKIQNTSKRDITIDIIKGLCIIMMVAGHTKFSGRNFVYTFHMAVFFMCSGYFFNYSKFIDNKNLVEYFIKKLKTLWLPFFLFNAFYVLLHNFFIRINFFTTDPRIADYGNTVASFWGIKHTIGNLIRSFLMTGTFGFGGAFWFVKVLFYIELLYAFVTLVCNKYIKKNCFILQSFFSAVFFVTGSLYFKADIHKILCYYVIFHLGKMFYFINSKIKYNICLCSTLAVTTFFLIEFVYLKIFNLQIELAGNSHSYTPVFFVATITGWIFVFSLSKILESISPVRKILILLGQHTLSILALHLIAFKSVTFIQILITKNDFYLLATHPVYIHSGIWWCIYTVTGCFLSIGLSKVFYMLKCDMYIMKVFDLILRIFRRFITEIPLNFLNKRNGQEGLIISLTSYPARLPQLHFVIRSLIRQSLRPQKIILYLGTDTKDSDIPEKLKKLTKYGFEIKTSYPDLKPHKKYFFAMQEYKDCAVVTVDDDIIYHKDFLRDLYNSYKKYPDCVHARRVTKLTATGNKLNEYEKFEYKYTKITEPSFSLLPIGCGGVLYPPHVFKEEDFNIDAVKENCLNTDDIWLKYIEVKNNVKVVFVSSEYEKDLSVRNTQASGLFHTNYEQGNRNDVSLKNLEKYTGINLADYL